MSAFGDLWIGFCEDAAKIISDKWDLFDLWDHFCVDECCGLSCSDWHKVMEAAYDGNKRAERLLRDNSPFWMFDVINDFMEDDECDHAADWLLDIFATREGVIKGWKEIVAGSDDQLKEFLFMFDRLVNDYMIA